MRLHLCPKRYPGLEINLHLMMKFNCFLRSEKSRERLFAITPRSIVLGVIVPVNVPSMDQIDRFKMYS